MNVDLEEDEEPREKLIKIYLTEDEKREIKLKAKKEKMSMSSYCRRKILNVGD